MRRHLVGALVGLAVAAGCGGDDDAAPSDPCAADEDGNARVADVAAAIDCHFDVDVRRVFISALASGTYPEIEPVDTTGMDEREIRVAQDAARDRAGTAIGREEWGVSDENDDVCVELGGDVLDFEVDNIPNVTFYTCVIPDEEITALNERQP